MKVEFNHKNCRNNFGMALYMDEKRIAKKLGKIVSDHAKAARPELEEMAKSCNIRIIPKKGAWGIVDGDNLTIRVTKRRSALLNLLDGLASKIDILELTGRRARVYKYSDNYRQENLAQRLIDSAKRVVDNVNK